ncbi:O-antigen ligase family protein, partial [Metabacillus idriensis]|uniref:O-antigen ligase family protein n=1 Tax=Metabacillus idriensis TaxID=324768 RepID=UPI00174996F1
IPLIYLLLILISKFNIESYFLLFSIVLFILFFIFILSKKKTFLYSLLFATLAFNIEYPIIADGYGYDVTHVGGLRAAVVINHFQILIFTIFFWNHFFNSRILTLGKDKDHLKVSRLFLFFLSTAILSTILSENILASLYVFFRYISLLFLALIILKNSLKLNLQYMIYGFMILIPVETVISLIQYITDSYAGFRILGESYEPFRATSLIDESEKGISGTLSHPGIMGLFLSLTIPLQIYYFISSIKYGFNKTRVVLFILSMVLIILTGSRTSLFITLFAIGLLLLFNIIGKKRFKKSNVVIALFSVIPVTILFFYTISKLGIVERFLNSDFIYQIFYRSDLNVLAISVLGDSAKNMIFGTGLNAYTDVVSSLGTGFAYEHPVHNFFLLMLVEGGLLHFLSIAILILYILSILINSIRIGNQKLLAFTLLVTVTISFIYCMFGWAMYHNQNMYFMSIILILAYQLRYEEGEQNE